MLHIPGLYIANDDKKGRMVCTAHAVSPGEVIEVCPLIILPASETSTIHQTKIHDYYFIWPDESGRTCIALGYGSLYNHSSRPNADVTFDLTDHTMIISCIKPIAAGEEISIDYQGGIKGAPELWFELQ